MGFSQLFKHIATTRLVCLIFNYHPSISFLFHDGYVRSWSWMLDSWISTMPLLACIGAGYGACFMVVGLLMVFELRNRERLCTLLAIPVGGLLVVIFGCIIMKSIFVTVTPLLWILPCLQALHISLALVPSKPTPPMCPARS